MQSPTGSGPSSYPPEHHLLRDLPFSMEAVDGDRSRGYLSVTSELCTDGRLSAGPLMTVIDVVAGGLVGRVLAPDWMATSQLSLHLDCPPATGEVQIDLEVLRQGRTTVVVEGTLRGSAAGEDTFGEAVITFVRLPRRDGNLDLSGFDIAYGERVSFARSDPGSGRSFGVDIGAVAEPSSGSMQVEVTDYVRNSFGAVNGGVVAAIAAEAARKSAMEVLGAACAVTDVVVHYMSQGRVGPLVAMTRVIRAGEAGVMTRVEVADEGSGDGSPRSGVMVVAHVQCSRVEA